MQEVTSGVGNRPASAADLSDCYPPWDAFQ